MTSAPKKSLADDEARRAALALHNRAFLIEAGAGSGKTAIMAGRVAMMLAEGITPKTIAVVTFTEFAASELLIRLREFVDKLTAGYVPAELHVALPDGLSKHHRQNLTVASNEIDEITCSTIHGFCQRLIKPYPVEANIDPGAVLMDSGQAELVFHEIVEAWLREELADDAGGLLAEMVLQDPGKTVSLVHTILHHLRQQRKMTVDASTTVTAGVTAFRQATDDFVTFVKKVEAKEPETALIVAHFSEMTDGITFALTAETPADLVRLLFARPHPDLCTATDGFRAYKKKSKWREAAKRAGFSQADGERLDTLAKAHYTDCCDAWNTMLQAVATRVLGDLVQLVSPVIDRFREYKRSTALLDFDDLIFAARDLLRDHEEVRRALASRFAHVLVDEFQDTDPLQTEIFWRLCGEPVAGKDSVDWTTFCIRPGALFLVGDPKQAIYRFRGADVDAYIQTRKAFVTQAPENVLRITTNFRSCPSILHYVNQCFEAPLTAENGQPGFTALDSFHPDRENGLSVVALDINVADEEGKASAERQRDGEAEAVAAMCTRLIGNETILDHKTGECRVCRPGDIALLAPTGSELWRYEEALERHGIPVATQAGKGFFRRQEIQDLIALTRVLADRRDTLALGALLRGPVVGLTEEELLDIVWALPRSEEVPDALPRLNLGVNPQDIGHTLARDMIEKLQVLYRRNNTTTPYDLLSQAVDMLRLRPILLQRHVNYAERALANVDLYLSLSQNYAVRGLRAFAEAMTTAWTEESRSVEGRPDAQEEAVALYTMHAAKGLEWPIVVPVNTMTQTKTSDSAFIRRATGHFYCRVFGVASLGYEAASAVEKAELERERIRLWYVAATRARELLILPRLDVATARSTWISLLDLSLANLPSLNLNHLSPDLGTDAVVAENNQTREIFAAEAAEITARQRHILWLLPSRAESSTEPVVRAETPEILAADAYGAPIEQSMPINVQGGRERGVLLHKLIEEVLTGEIEGTASSLHTRAAALILAIGCPIVDDPAQGLVPAELAGCVLRALALPEIAVLRPRLMPEFPVYASTFTDDREEAAMGIVDAIAFGPNGTPQIVIDWKSDVDPAPETVEHYRAQVRAYLDMTETERGLIVLMTRGTVIQVTRSSGTTTAS